MHCGCPAAIDARAEALYLPLAWKKNKTHSQMYTYDAVTIAPSETNQETTRVNTHIFIWKSKKKKFSKTHECQDSVEYEH